MRKLLFELLTWHAFAKSRLHTETTVTDLENSTRRLGEALRTFKNVVCSAYKTYELLQEKAACSRCEAAANAKRTSNLPVSITTETTAKTISSSWRLHQFNLDTYKIHALGDYADAIRQFGTADSYNSQTVSDQVSLYYLL